MKRNLKGFTLVELIVVMAIIAVLAAILIPNLLHFLDKAKFTQANANAKTIFTAVNSAVAMHTHDHTVFTPGEVIYFGKVDGMEITAPDESVINMKGYLDGMDGNASITVNDLGIGVKFVTWSIGNPPSEQATAQQQKKGLYPAVTNNNNTGDVVGCYPLIV